MQTGDSTSGREGFALYVEVIGEGLGEFEEESFPALTGAPPVAVVPIAIVNADEMDLEFWRQAAIYAARAGGVPGAGHDQNPACSARAQQRDRVARFFESAAGFPTGFEEETGREAVGNREFDCKCGIGARVAVAAVGRDDHRRISRVSQFRAFQYAIASAVAGENDDGVSFDRRAVGFEDGADASQNGR